MIEIKQIGTADKEYYNYMEELLIASFPPEEYRELSELREFTDHRSNFHNCIIFHNNTSVGFVTYWDFDQFYYIEHLAINPDQRNGGYGQKLLAYLADKLQSPIVLEVEHPSDEMAKRRINFYKRQGFVLWENDYTQPSYKPGHNSIPMYIMALGNLEKDKDYEMVKSSIYREVYKQ